MASQQVLFAETIMAMKKAKKRKAYESDSDSDVQNHGNRGQKLKKRARFTRQGQLAPPSGPEVYREIVDHAGHQRAIISRNPPLIDDEGYEVDSDDDDDQIQEALDTVAEFNPYANVRLESILAPLTTVTDLANHPTLARPYTTKTLSELAEQGCSVMQKENKALWRIKHLQTRLMGDHTWIPCEMMIGPNDLDLFRNDYLERINQAKDTTGSDTSGATLDHPQGEGSTNGKASTSEDSGIGRPKDPATEGGGPSNGDTPMVDVEPPEDERIHNSDSKMEVDSNHQENSSDHNAKENTNTNIPERPPSENGEANNNKNTTKNAVDKPMVNGITTDGEHKEANDRVTSQKGQAQQDADGQTGRHASMSPDPTEGLTIHPLFLAPRSAHPDRDVGLPGDEAEDIRRLLQLYVQKQEEVCRGSKRLYEGLLRADRMRKTVLQWSKYEAHVGPNCALSDGEDWYDKEEWGLEEDLKKGQDEEEEDTTQPAKKTRTRR